MHLVLVRHGETEANLAMRWSGSKDLTITNLTDTGRMQATKLGRWFKDRRFTPTHVYSSPQKRAYDTAQLAGGQWGLPITKMEDLRETGAGIFEGMTWREIEDQYPKEAELFQDSRNWSFIQDAESEQGRRERGARVLRYVIDNHSNNDTVVMFAHAGIIQQAVSAIFESPRLWGLAARNTALYEFAIDVEHWDEDSSVRSNPTAWRILRFNEQPHLS